MNMKRTYLRTVEYILYAPLSAFWVLSYFVFAVLQLLAIPFIGLERAQTLLQAYDAAHARFEEVFEEEYEKTLGGRTNGLANGLADGFRGSDMHGEPL